MADTLDDVAAQARACTVCASVLPLGPRPILRVSTTARLLIASQAPGTKVHASGTPWTDESGKRLRGWLGMTPEQFYDGAHVAILPMGLCYPGRFAKGGDLPPRPECAPLWRSRLLGLMPQLQLTLLVGSYAQVDALGRGPTNALGRGPTNALGRGPADADGRGRTNADGRGPMTERVRAWRDHLPRFFPLPHPSWRTGVWETRNPWFVTDVLPGLRAEVARVMAGPPPPA